LNIEVRKAKLDDVEGIVNVYCSSVRKWYKIADGKEVEYKDLNIIERWSFGGPWMSIETCAIHLNYMLMNHQYPLIAVFNNNIVGELELFIGEEKGVLGKTAFIDVLEVHRNYRQRGLGKALVNKAIEIAKKQGCDTISVWPTKEATGFYVKCGISEVAYRVANVEINLENIELKHSSFEILSFPRKYMALKSLELISPRMLSSFSTWLKSTWKYALGVETISYKGYIPMLKAAFIIENLWMKKDMAKLTLWTLYGKEISSVLNVVFSIAKNIGFKKLHVSVGYDTYSRYLRKHSHKLLGNEILLLESLSSA